MMEQKPLNSIYPYWLALSFLFIAFPYIGPSFLGLGVKPIWLICALFPALFVSKEYKVIVFVFMVIMLLDSIRWIAIQADYTYGLSLWILMALFIFSRHFFIKVVCYRETLQRFSIFFYSIFIFLYVINYLYSNLYNEIFHILIGQVRTTGRADFAFAAPESGLGAFSVLTIAYMAFHLSIDKSLKYLVAPVVCLLLIGSATSFALALLWAVHYIIIRPTSLGVREWGYLPLFLIFVFYFFYDFPDLVTERFLSILNFDLQGNSSVSIRARDILLLLDSQTYSIVYLSGPVGVVKAISSAPGFALFVFIMMAFYLKISDLILVIPALVLLPIVHPFIWIVLGLARVIKSSPNRNNNSSSIICP